MTTAALSPETTPNEAASARPDAAARIPGPAQPGSPAQQDYSPQPGYPAQPAEDARGLAITSFVLGIASVVSGWTFVAPITGLILGIIALRRRTGERTLALWGVWLNGVMLALTVLVLFAAAALVSIGVFSLPFLVA